MSYDIYLYEPGTDAPVEFDDDHYMEGGTYSLGGTREAWLNITYNYSSVFYRVFPDNGIRTIYGMTGSESLPLLEAAIAQLRDDTSEDYWECTEGNAKRALAQLAAMARMRPDGVWGGD